MAESNYYVSSRGLMKSCDYSSSTPISSIKQLINYSDFFNETKQIPTLYVCSSAIPDFCKRMLPHITFPFILVSGDCDETVPYDIFTQNDFEVFINNPNLIKWFCQNLVIYHPKIINIPIGLDYHTMEKRDIWGPIITPANQEKLLTSIVQTSKPFYERKIMCYSNFHFAMTTKYAYDRKDAITQIPKNLIYYEPTQITRLKTWHSQKDYAFVVSPHGNGYDCHRTWEALALNCIPIVKTSKIDILYDDLPVLIVNEWSDITLELLHNTVAQFKLRKFNYDTLSLKYWVDKFNSSKNSSKMN